MPTALVIMHDAHTSAGMIGEAAEARGFELVEVLSQVGDDQELPDPGDHDVVLLTGSPEHWYEIDHHPQLQRELAFVKDAVAKDVPVFGMCFGGQALSLALGGEVGVMDDEEVGWFDVTTADPSLIEPGPWFMWHNDEFSLPDGAEELARTDCCVHAFRHGPHLGLQFHPEFTYDYVSKWESLLPRTDDIDPAELVRLTKEYEPEARVRAQRLFDTFLSWHEDR